MKSSIVLYGLIAGASAMPALVQKRDVVWQTATKEVIETVWSTKTVWVDAGAPASSGFQGFERSTSTKAHSTHKHRKTKTHHLTTTHTHTKLAAPATPTSIVTPYAPPSPPPSVATPLSSSTPLPPPPPPPPSSSFVPPPPPRTTTTPAAIVHAQPKPSTTSTPTPPPSMPTPAPVIISTPKPSPKPSPSPSPAPSPAPSAQGNDVGAASSSPSGGLPNSGDGTFYTPGMGSCGIVSSDNDMIVAVGIGWMKANFVGANPNANPNCGKTIHITYGGVTETATIVDTCAGCAGAEDLDMSPALFQKFASESTGRISGVKWGFS